MIVIDIKLVKSIIVLFCYFRDMNYVIYLFMIIIVLKLLYLWKSREMNWFFFIFVWKVRKKYWIEYKELNVFI